MSSYNILNNTTQCATGNQIDGFVVILVSNSIIFSQWCDGPKIEILRSVRITHAGSYICVQHCFALGCIFGELEPFF